MDKKALLELIRERLHKVLERGTSPVQGIKADKPVHHKERNDNTEYAEIQRALTNTMLKKSQVMAAAGLGDPDDAGDRRAFNAKLDKEPNEEGSIRKFSDDELAAVAKVVSNPKSYLGKKTDIR
jgi:hypothetical protein